MIKAIIFDFDGVIAESVNVKTKAFAELYQPYGKDVVQKVVDHHLANGGVSRFEKFKIYHRDFLGKNISEKDINNLATKFSTMVLNNVVQSPYVPGAESFIKENFDKYMMFISSGTPELEIKEICERRLIKKYFIQIFGSPESKSVHIQKIVKNWDLKSQEVLFIGDAPSDYNAAKENGLHFIGVGDTIKTIEKFNDYVIDHMHGIGEIIGEIAH